ncbi:MAG: hypothetical protein ACXVXC_12140 [Nocardioidaceae bacterium]
MTLRPDERNTDLVETSQEPEPEQARKGLDVSLSQTVGGSLAAATAAYLGSRLGVVGTIVGAAVVSVVSAVAGVLYTNSLRRTRETMARAVRAVDGPPEGTRSHRWLVGAMTVTALGVVGVAGLGLVAGSFGVDVVRDLAAQLHHLAANGIDRASAVVRSHSPVT